MRSDEKRPSDRGKFPKLASPRWQTQPRTRQIRGERQHSQQSERGHDGLRRKFRWRVAKPEQADAYSYDALRPERSPASKKHRQKNPRHQKPPARRHDEKILPFLPSRCLRCHQARDNIRLFAAGQTQRALVQKVQITLNFGLARCLLPQDVPHHYRPAPHRPRNRPCRARSGRIFCPSG